MGEFDLGKVRAVVADGSPMIRQGVRNALYGMGFREIVDTGAFTTVHEMCKDDRVDLLIVNSDLENNESSFIIREMRRTRLGGDPFVVVVSLLPIADAAHVRKVVDSGADDLLLIPFAPDQLCSRLQTLVSRRKPFVVTHDYVGPDRRKNHRGAPGGTARQFLPPNPVAARAGGVPPQRYRQLVEQASIEIRTWQVQSLAEYVKREGRELFAASRDGEPMPDDIATRMVRLERIVDELLEFGGKTLDLSEFTRLCGNIKAAQGPMAFGDIERLHAQTEAISARYGRN